MKFRVEIQLFNVKYVKYSVKCIYMLYIKYIKFNVVSGEKFLIASMVISCLILDMPSVLSVL